MKRTQMGAAMDDLSVEFQPDKQQYIIKHGGGMLLLDETEVRRLRHMLGFMVPDWRGDDRGE